jgi:hypothetical protein
LFGSFSIDNARKRSAPEVEAFWASRRRATSNQMQSSGSSELKLPVSTVGRNESLQHNILTRICACVSHMRNGLLKLRFTDVDRRDPAQGSLYVAKRKLHKAVYLLH